MLKLVTFSVLTCLLMSQQTFASGVGFRITPDNQKKSNLNFVLSIQEKGDIYLMKFETTKEGALENLFRVDLVLYEGDKRLLVAPLEQHTSTKESQKVSLEFILDKAILKGAVLNLRTGNNAAEVDFELQLVAYAHQPTAG